MVLIGLVGGGFALWSKLRSPGDDGFYRSPTITSATRAPTKAWSIQMPSIAKGGPWTKDGRTSVRELGDLLLVSARGSGSNETGQITVVDPASGKIRWSSKETDDPGYCDRLDDLLLCGVPENTDSRQHIIAYDINNGSVRFRTESEPNLGWEVADALYTYSSVGTDYKAPTKSTITKYSPDGKKVWTNTDLYKLFNADAYGMRLAAGRVAMLNATMKDGKAFVLDASTGLPAPDRPVGIVVSAPVDGYWSAEPASNDAGLIVRGRTIGEGQGDVAGALWYTLDGAGQPVVLAHVGRDDARTTSVYSFKGHESTLRFRSDKTINGFCGERAMAFGNEGMIGLDSRTGAQSWSEPILGAWDWRCTASGDALMAAIVYLLPVGEGQPSTNSGSRLVGVNTKSGNQLWTAPLENLRVNPTDRLETTFTTAGFAVLSVSNTDTMSATLHFLKAN